MKVNSYYQNCIIVFDDNSKIEVWSIENSNWLILFNLALYTWNIKGLFVSFYIKRKYKYLVKYI